MKQRKRFFGSLCTVLGAAVVLSSVFPALAATADSPSLKKFTLDFEQTYTNSSGEFYHRNIAENWSATQNMRGSRAEMVTQKNGNRAVRLTYDTEQNGENYNANAVLALFDPDTATKFSGTPGTRYTITFDYQVEETDSKELQLFLVPSAREKGYPNGNYGFASTDMGPKAVMGRGEFPFDNPATPVIKEATSTWQTASVSYVAQEAYSGHTVCPVILLQTNGKQKDATQTGQRPFASVLIDKIRVEEFERRAITILCHDYDGEDRKLSAYNDSVVSDLTVPSRKGWLFEGFYTDAQYQHRLQQEDSLASLTEIYAKWSGGGKIVTPQEITDSMSVAVIRPFASGWTNTNSLDGILFQQNSLLEGDGLSGQNWNGAYVFSSQTEYTRANASFMLTNLNLIPPADSVLFRVSLPEYEQTGKDWCIGLKGVGLKQGTDANAPYIWTYFGTEKSTFEYAVDGEWIPGKIGANGEFYGLPSGYSGYIRLNLKNLTYASAIDFDSTYRMDAVEFRLNALGGEVGDLVFSGAFYAPKTDSQSTVMKIGEFFFELSDTSRPMTVLPFDAYDPDARFSVRYAGTKAEADAAWCDTETSALFAKTPVGIVRQTGKPRVTLGSMTVYENPKAELLMQPGADSWMFYVEMPEYEGTENCAGLKLLDSVLVQETVQKTVSFSNSIYAYADVSDGSWKIARAGADGELWEIPSGFCGYIRLNIKHYKNAASLNGIDFSKPYTLKGFSLGFNYVGGESEKLVIGSLYSIINPSDTTFLQNGMTGEVLCLKALRGDADCNGEFDTLDLATVKKLLAGIECPLSAAAKIRCENLTTADLAYMKKVCAALEQAHPEAAPYRQETYPQAFASDIVSGNTPKIYGIEEVKNPAARIEADTTFNRQQKAKDFVKEIETGKIGDFEKTGIDKMCHVSTFVYAAGNIYVTYYANTVSAAENPAYQVARMAWAPEENPQQKVILDIMQVGDTLYGKRVTGVYDTILMQREDQPETLYILWTASINGKYYRLYRTFDIATGKLGEIGVNRFKVGNVINDFSSSGMKNALTANSIGYKEFFSDIGIMQKLSSRVENGERWYYSGSYSGNFTCIIKSKDLITWEYVAQPNEGANGTGFANATKWENAVYVLGDRVYYFVRQHDPGSPGGSAYGILTAYDLITGEWEPPVLVGDCQSRSDFIYYQGGLYLFYAPTDRNHIGILRINTENLAESKVVLQADMQSSCFYPFVQYNSKGELCMSYTVNRRYIRLASFTLSKYLD